MKIFIDFSSDCFSSQSVEMLWDLIKIFPFFYRISIFSFLVVSLFDFFEIFDEIAEIFIFVVIDFIFDLLCDRFSCLIVALFPHVLVLLHEISYSFFKSFFQFLHEIRMAFLSIKWPFFKFCQYLLFQFTLHNTYITVFYRFLQQLFYLGVQKLSSLFDCSKALASTDIKPCTFHIRKCSFVDSIHVALAQSHQELSVEGFVIHFFCFYFCKYFSSQCFDLGNELRSQFAVI